MSRWKGDDNILTNIQDLFNIIPVAGILTFLIFIVKTIVNSVTAHELDKLFSTSWNKFVEMSIAISLVSLSYFVIITTEIFKIEVEEFIKDPEQGLLYIITLLSMIIWIISSLVIIANAIYKGLCKQYVYYIVENNGTRWKIEKAVSNEKFYVGIDNKKKVIKVDDDTIFESDIEQSEIAIKIFNKINMKVKNKKSLNIILTSLLIILVLIMVVTIFNNKELTVLIASIGLYLMILVWIFKIGYSDYLELNNISSQSDTLNNDTNTSIN